MGFNWLQASDLSASDMDLACGRGSISVRRLLGLHLKVQTRGAPISIKAAYGESLDISTGVALRVWLFGICLEVLVQYVMGINLA